MEIMDYRSDTIFLNNLAKAFNVWYDIPDDVNDKLAWDDYNKIFYISGRVLSIAGNPLADLNSSWITSYLKYPAEVASRNWYKDSTLKTARKITDLISDSRKDFDSLLEKLNARTFPEKEIGALTGMLDLLDRTLMTFDKGVQCILGGTQDNEKKQALADADTCLLKEMRGQIEKLSKAVMCNYGPKIIFCSTYGSKEVSEYEHLALTNTSESYFNLFMKSNVKSNDFLIRTGVFLEEFTGQDFDLVIDCLQKEELINLENLPTLIRFMKELSESHPFSSSSFLRNLNEKLEEKCQRFAIKSMDVLISDDKYDDVKLFFIENNSEIKEKIIDEIILKCKIYRQAFESGDYSRVSLKEIIKSTLIYARFDYYRKSPIHGLLADLINKHKEQFFSLCDFDIFDDKQFQNLNRLAKAYSMDLRFDKFFVEEFKKILVDYRENSEKIDSTQLKKFLVNYFSSNAPNAIPHDLLELINEIRIKEITNYVNANKEQILAGKFGAEARSQPWTRKFTVDTIIPKSSSQPSTVRYDKETKQIILVDGEIGKGTFKVVKKYLLLNEQELQAIGKQELDPKRSDLTEMSEKEIKILALLKGKSHVLQFHRAKRYTSQKKKAEVQSIITEYCNMGELKDLLRKKLTDKLRLQIACGIVKGLLNLHGIGVIHRDLKPENIFLKQGSKILGEYEIYAVVADFGLSCFAENDEDIETFAGNKQYMAPEVLSGQPASYSSDAWGVGMMFSQLFFGKAPVSSSLNALVKSFDTLNTMPEPANKQSLEYVVWKLLRKNPKERMALAQALDILEDKLTKIS